MLIDLADDFPLLSSLVERRAGGQRKLPIGRGGVADARELLASAVALATDEREAPDQAVHSGPAVEPDPPTESASGPRPAESGGTATVLQAAAGPRRPAHYGLSIQFEAHDDDPELGRLVESTVWVNTAHPAYRRAMASRSEGYHLALSVAMALAPLAVEPSQERTFVCAFLERWGSAVTASGVRRRD